MVPVTSPLAAASVGVLQGAGPSWWQAVGALAAVLALLLLSMRLLSRWHRPAGRKTLQGTAIRESGRPAGNPSSRVRPAVWMVTAAANGERPGALVPIS